MKKTIIFAICAFALFACDESVRDCTVYNRSDYVVTYTMFGTPGELTIQPGETQVYTQTTNYPLSFSSNPNRVQYRLAGGKTFEFINADPIQLVVTNKWPFAIKLSADNYMESEPLDIEKNSQVNSVIYTNSPRFKIEEVPGYTTKASYSTNNGIMYVVID